jgi:hypothetical protein
MSVPGTASAPSVPDVRWWRVRLVLGIVAIVVGVAASAWPTATVRVVGLLFGLNLVVTGAVRTVLLVFAPGYPLLYRHDDPSPLQVQPYASATIRFGRCATPATR